LCARARVVVSVSLDPTRDSFIRALVGWVTRRDVGGRDGDRGGRSSRGEGRGRRWRENAPFRSFVRSFVRVKRDAVDANARVDASRRACRPRVSPRGLSETATRGRRGRRRMDGWMDG
jgi:hypothetical protein